MNVTSVPYDLVFLVHIVGALATVVVLVTLRVSAQGASRSNDLAVARRHFPDRTDWAARVVHIMPVTGFTMSLMGDKDVAMSRPWVGVGLVLYFVLAFWLEARTLPVERSLARELAAGEDARGSAQRFARRLDTALSLVGVILVVMVVQF